MKTIARIAIGGLAFAMPWAPAAASGDYSCSPDWSLTTIGGIDCGDRAMLAPGNDTRTNLFFLQFSGNRIPARTLPYLPNAWDGQGFGSTFFSWSALVQSRARGTDGDSSYVTSASRCDSLDAGANAFKQAMAANAKLSQGERDTLAEARGKLAARCSGTSGSPLWPGTIASAPGRAFLDYLKASDAFYAGAWDDSRDIFSGLQKAPDKWVAETATYMLIRVEINAAQEHAFDDYGYFQGPAATDQRAIAQAGEAIEAYLKRYSKGRYAESAKGLKRRVLWLAGDNAALASEYEGLLARLPAGSAEALSLIQEIDNKLLFAKDAGQAIRTPYLLAAHDLLQMRNYDDAADPRLSASELDTQERYFSGQAGLFAYLRAAQAYYVQRDYQRVLALVPAAEAGANMSPVDFSRQILRGMALTGIDDPRQEGHWKALRQAAKAPYQRELAELGLALVWQKAGSLSHIFAQSSPVQDSTIREIVLSRIAGPDLLRQVAGDGATPQRQRDVALFALLQKNLLTGRYADFLRDRAMVPANADANGYLWDFPFMETIPVGMFAAGKWSDGFACPALPATAETLARNPADPKGRLCLADFWRLNGFDHFEALDPKEDISTLGGGPGQFPGSRATRASIYSAVISDPKATADNKAYALYRAIYCYAPSGNNDCGGDDVPQTQRRAWFQRLKKDYPSSRWAQELSYYW
jgi:hypothetical protein